MPVLTFAETLGRLREEADHTPQPCDPQRLPLNEIKTAEVVFQPRDTDAAWLATDSHVKVLAEAVKERANDAFDPLTVWWSGSMVRDRSSPSADGFPQGTRRSSQAEDKELEF